MVAVHLVTAVAHKETAKQAILKRLREAGATSPVMPSTVEIDSDDGQAALADLLAAGTVQEARPGLYFLAEAKAKESRPGAGLIALLVVLVVISFIASLIALATAAA